MFLCGSYSHQLDDKNRIRLPAKLRAVLEDKYILLPGTSGCLYLVKADESQNILQALSQRESLDNGKEELRTLTSNAFAVEADSQGRFMLPELLKNFAGIKKDVLINGNISKVEIWSKERWDARNAAVDLTPEGIDKIYHTLGDIKTESVEKISVKFDK